MKLAVKGEVPGAAVPCLAPILTTASSAEPATTNGAFKELSCRTRLSLCNRSASLSKILGFE